MPNYNDVSLTDLAQEQLEAYRLKDLFGRLKRLYDPGYKGPSKKFDYVWPKLLAVLRDNDIGDPARYLTLQLDAVGSSLLPNQLISDAAVQRYIRRMAHDEEEARLLLHLQACKVKSRLQWKGYRDILMDRYEELEPLARVCFAADKGMSDVVEEFLDEAAKQYLLRRKTYDKVYGNIIPEVVKCRADNLLHSTKKD